MKLDVTNFGPIESANIEIKPLTIIIGKNNVGKSYITQLIQILNDIFAFETILVSYKDHAMGKGKKRAQYKYLSLIKKRFYYYPLTDNEMSKLRKLLKDVDNNEKVIFEFLKEILEKKLIKELEEQLITNIQRIFGMPISKLILLGKISSTINYEINQYCSTKIVISQKNKLSLTFYQNEEQIKNIKNKLYSKINKLKKSKRLNTDTIIELITDLSINYLSTDIEDSLYIPAGRAGLIEIFETVGPSQLNFASLGVSGIQMPPIPGTASQFYLRLLSLQDKKGPLSNISEKIKNILDGNITIKKSKGIIDTFKVDYTFKKNNTIRKMNVIYTASMIKEIAPIYLLLKEMINENCYLIIEEIESHLHPSAQCSLIKILIEYLSHNVGLLLTVHSDIIIRYIGNVIGNALIDDKFEPKLLSEQMHLYLLKENEFGSIALKIEIPKDGIFENIPEFDDVLYQLYEEQLKINQKLQ